MARTRKRSEKQQKKVLHLSIKLQKMLCAGRKIWVYGHVLKAVKIYIFEIRYNNRNTNRKRDTTSI